MKQLLLFFTILTTTTLVAQHKYIPFPDSNAIWVTRHLNEFGQEEGGGQYFIQRDTIIKGIGYRKVVGTTDSTLYTPGGPKESWFAFRNDTAGRKVFIYDRFDGGGKESLLYNFSLQVGDTFPKNSYGKSGRYGNSVVIDIDTIMIDANEHLVFYSNSPTNGNLLPYIEGIGSVAGPIHQPYFFEGGFELVCLMLGKDRKPYYTTPGLECKLYHYTGIDEKEAGPPLVIVYPQPLTVNSVIELQGEADLIGHLTVYSMDGKTVLEEDDLRTRSFNIGPEISTKGMYFYRLQTDKGEGLSGKFIRG